MNGKVLQGTLRKAKNGKTWVLVTPNGKELQISHGAVSQSLWPLGQKARDGMTVDFESENGLAHRIRRPGEAWSAPATAPTQRASASGTPRRGGHQAHRAQPRGGPAPARSGGASSPAPPPRAEYHNPYNFIPAPPRQGGGPSLGDLGDHRPPGHHRYHPDRWTGRIDVRMRTATPLLLPDAQRARPVRDPGAAAEHRLFPVRTVDGKPYVPPTSVKGMLRTAYEAVTNSRFGVFGNEHKAPLAYRAFRSRRLFAKSPWDLLPVSLRPARSVDELSPADRVFGWVRDGDGGGRRAEPAAWRGCLRVGRVTCLSDDPVEEFPGDGLPLAIFGQPKPQQFRFYAAVDASGTPLPGVSKETAYTDGQGLRGRKVYPHHAGLPGGYWDNPMEDRTQDPVDKWYQEYRRPRKGGAEQRDTQNRSLGGWVKPNVEFDFSIHVENLSEVELGALLWLLSLDEDYHHRLGGGKPLGFGSVRLSIERTELWNGEALRESYLSLEPAHAPSPEEQEQFRSRLIQAYKQAVERGYGNGSSFEKIPFIAAFLQAASGFKDGKPVHYPRTAGQRAPDPEGEGYRWFVANERTNGPKLSLRALWNDQGLPYLPDR